MNWNRKNLGGSGKWKLFVRCLKIVENSQKTKWKMDSRKLKISELLILNFKLVKINFLWIRLLNYSMMFVLRVYLFYSKIEYFQFYYSYNSIEFLFSRESHSHECLTFRFSDKVSFQSQKRLYNHKCPSVRSSIWLFVLKTPEQLEIIILHQSSFIILHSSFIIFNHPSFISWLLSFSACLNLHIEMLTYLERWTSDLYQEYTLFLQREVIVINEEKVSFQVTASCISWSSPLYSRAGHSSGD